MSATALWASYFTLVGLAVGSYLNVLIHRLPRREPTAVTRSRCPRCLTPIASFDNIPLFSYLLLRGRCRACGARISPRYPLVEATTGLLFLASFLRFGLGPSAFAAAVFCALSVALAFIDAEHFMLPDKLTLPGIAIGLLFAPWVEWTGERLLPSLLGAVVGGGLLLALYLAWWWIRGEEGMGLGDVKMIAMQGAFLGWQGMLVTLLVGSVLGSLFGLALIAIGRVSGGSGLKTKLPFGTFLAIAGVLALFSASPLIRWYAGFF